MRFVGLVLVGAVMMAGPAFAQMDSRDAIALQNQILELRQQIQGLQQRGAERRRRSTGPTGRVVGMAV